MATPEKAVVELFWDLRTDVESVDLDTLLQKDRRISKSSLSELDEKRLIEFTTKYGFSEEVEERIKEYFGS